MNSVPDVAEAIRRANATPYALGSAVYSRRRGPEIAAQLRAGMTSINGVIAYAGVSGLPFGGVGESGSGRIHGVQWLQEFSRTKATTRRLFPLPIAVQALPRSPLLVKVARRYAGLKFRG